VDRTHTPRDSGALGQRRTRPSTKLNINNGGRAARDHPHPTRERSVSVEAVLLGGEPPGSVPVTWRDSRKIWPLLACHRLDLSVTVTGTGLAHQLA